MKKRRSPFFEARDAFIGTMKSVSLPVNGNQLPSEEVLSKRMNISRTTMRELLASLSREGVISKKHGLGNFLHHSALEKRMRIDQTRDFGKLIELGGYNAEYRVDPQSFRTGVAGTNILKAFPELADVDFFSMDCTFFADSVPAIFCELNIPAALLKNAPSELTEESVYAFLHKYSGEEIVHTMIDFEPVIAGPELCGVFGIEKGTPVIGWNEKFYNIHDRVVCYSIIRFNPVIMKVCMLRKTWEDLWQEE